MCQFHSKFFFIIRPVSAQRHTEMVWYLPHKLSVTGVGLTAKTRSNNKKKIYYEIGTSFTLHLLTFISLKQVTANLGCKML